MLTQRMIKVVNKYIKEAKRDHDNEARLRLQYVLVQLLKSRLAEVKTEIRIKRAL